ncbi:hypothetical protein GGR22_000730 [Flavobacterium gossypii]|uniref:Sigma-70 family RNA polymerase sigma factor n=1 Tax=Flavobacterium gossypii TaxID=1646119 RepID=A0ABR6DMA7_9FLAO|nr:hypothetical protein [Flavobacterium gossypii]MBA9072604.1 hypothetical protein [Flavobacterium gossypii]
MTIIEKQAVPYIEDLFDTRTSSTLEGIKGEIQSKLYLFDRDKDRLYFLNILRKGIYEAKIKHEETCTNKTSCSYSDQRDNALFIIDQELDSLNQYFTAEIPNEDRFTPEQESEQYSKINEVLDKLEKLGYGQEVIFKEIEELKLYFNLGKKNWTHLLAGKLMDISVTTVIEKTIVEDAFNSLIKGLQDFPFLISK